MKETRSSILLRRMAAKMRKETGNMAYRARIEDEGVSIWTLIFISCTRPIRECFISSMNTCPFISRSYTHGAHRLKL